MGDFDWLKWKKERERCENGNDWIGIFSYR